MPIPPPLVGHAGTHGRHLGVEAPVTSHITFQRSEGFT
jgi:hypothetical protein